jgi:hypothetical protein
MDGGFVGVADVSDVMRRVGASAQHRLVGGLTVMLHVQRLGLDLPLRATGDADFGVAPHRLRDGTLIGEVEALGYERTAGNRWERMLDERRTAAIDLLVPAYTSRARDDVQVGDIVTTEVPGLTIALQRPSVDVAVDLVSSDGSMRSTTLVLADALSTLAMKAYARTVRSESRDAEDLWRALEVCLEEGTKPADFDDGALREVKAIIWRELGPEGDAMNVLTTGLQEEPAARVRTRIKALLAEVVGNPE